jgi:hypothetical protein
MPIPSRQIGWSTQDNLLWQIAKQMEQASCQLCTLNDNIGIITGTSGTSGSSGTNGTSGTSGTSGTAGQPGDRYQTTSSSTFTLGTGGTITVGTGLAYTTAQDVLIAYDINNHQVSMVTSYNPLTGVLVFGAPSQLTGSGTYNSWGVNLNGAAGGNGTNGTSGTAGTSGTSATSGTSGSTGTSGTSGTTGTSGTSGTSGVSGSSGTSGVALYYGSFIFNSATTLTAGMNSNSTLPIQVASTTGFFSPGYIRIGAEIIAYTGIAGNTFTGITRGVAGSNGANHSIGAGVSQAQYTPAGVPKQVLLDETDLSNGVTLNPLTGDVTIANAGVYNLQFSAQLENFSNDVEDAIIWFTVNGVDVPKSATYITTPTIHGGTPGATLMTVNIFYAITGGDVVGLKWTSNQGKTAITSIPPVGSTIPQSPGVIFTVNKIGI